MYDLIIVGGGPAGLAAALSAKRLGLTYLVLERSSIASTIDGYPLARLLFSTSDEVELEAGALRPGKRPTREELLEHYITLAEREQINIHTGEDVDRIGKTGDDCFAVDTMRDRYQSRTVLVAIGGFGRQRRLNASGEDASRVSYTFTEAAPYAMRPVLVVGGGNSAAEAALSLAEAGARVVLSIRRPSLDIDQPANQTESSKIAPKTAMIKPWVREPLDRAIRGGQIRLVTASNVIEIRRNSAILKVKGEAEIEVECDHIFALIGADPDTRLLEEAGAEVAADGRPIYDAQSYETTVSGLYVAGHITRDLHMKNAGLVARRVVDRIASRLLGVIPEICAAG